MKIEHHCCGQIQNSLIYLTLKNHSLFYFREIFWQFQTFKYFESSILLLSYYRSLTLICLGILFNNYGHSWKTLRRFTLQTLRDFGVGKDSIEEKVFQEIDAVSKGFEDLKGQPVDFNYYMQNLVGNIVFGIIFGNR